MQCLLGDAEQLIRGYANGMDGGAMGVSIVDGYGILMNS
jgi:hypothetical protein